MSLEKLDVLLQQLADVYESDEAETYGEAGNVDWRSVERFVGWICGHSQNALAASKVKDEPEVNQELGRAVLMIAQALSALGHAHEAQDLMKVGKQLRTAEVAEAEVQEASLSRVYQHFKEGVFGLMSAFRPNYSEEENMARQFTLGQDVRRLGLGFFPVLGKWQGVSERGMFIPSISQQQILALGDRYQQEAVLHGAKGVAQLMSTDGTVLEVFKNLRILSFDKEFDNYAALRTKGGEPRGAFKLAP